MQLQELLELFTQKDPSKEKAVFVLKDIIVNHYNSRVSSAAGFIQKINPRPNLVHITPHLYEPAVKIVLDENLMGDLLKYEGEIRKMARDAMISIANKELKNYFV